MNEFDEVEIVSRHLTAKRKERIDQVLQTRSKHVVPILYDLYDARNIAAILRTTEGFGLQEAHILEVNKVERWPKRVTQGSDQWLDVHWHDNVKHCFAGLRKRGYEIWVADMDGTELPDFPHTKPVALLLGSEHDGVPLSVKSQADGVVSVPMRGFTRSFNVSVAAGIALYHLLSMRGWQAAGELTEAEKQALHKKWHIKSCKHADKIIAHERKRFVGA